MTASENCFSWNKAILLFIAVVVPTNTFVRSRAFWRVSKFALCSTLVLSRLPLYSSPQLNAPPILM